MKDACVDAIVVVQTHYEYSHQIFLTYEHCMQRAFATKKNCQADGGVVMSAGDRPASIHSGHQSEPD